MSYSEVDGKVVLTMSKTDYMFLLTCLGMWRASDITPSGSSWEEFINRLNEGNPGYQPYR